MPGLVEITVAVATCLTALIGLLGWWARRLYKDNEDLKKRHDPQLKFKYEQLEQDYQRERERNAELQQARGTAQHTIDALRVEKLSLEKELEAAKACARKYVKVAQNYGNIAKQLQERVKKFKAYVEELHQKHRDQLQSTEVQSKQSREDLEKTLAGLNEQLEKDGKALHDHEEQRAKILDPQRRVWEREVPKDAPRFVPRSERRATIISVLNLKGGVGKTTLTANLAATLGHADHQVQTLVIDLDYQRSLTRLCCPPQQVKQLHENRQCIQHFFLEPSPVDRPAGQSLSRILTRNMAEVRRKKSKMFNIVACSEDNTTDDVSGTLDDTEMHLFAEWLLEAGSTDLRFRLREALHDAPMKDAFDFILIDCPPRLSLACINALAASDFILIPTIPDETSIRSVPLIIKMVDRLRQIPGLLPNLTIPGVVANKVQYKSGALVEHQRVAWSTLPALAREARNGTIFHSEQVLPFETLIPHAAAFGNAVGEDAIEFASLSHKSIRDVFSDLIHELESRIDNESSHPAGAPPKSSQTVGSKPGLA